MFSDNLRLIELIGTFRHIRHIYSSEKATLVLVLICLSWCRVYFAIIYNKIYKIANTQFIKLKIFMT